MRLRRLEPVLRRALRGPCRLPPGSTLLVAVSGGADSTALLVALASLAREFGLRLHAAHLHHGLRGPDADADLRHVRELCARLDLPLTAARWDCAARMRRRALSGEAGLRTLRREFLLQAARRRRATAIATAHTADDQLETLLLRLARGTGLTGAAGMRARHGAWVKPLLLATRADVERDLVGRRIAWREDASNAGAAYARNRVRHAVVPALLDALGTPGVGAGTSPAVRRAGLALRASALAGELDGAERVLARAAAHAFDRVLCAPTSGPGTRSRPAHPPAMEGRGPDPAALDVVALARLALPIRRLVLKRAWRLLGPVGVAAPGLTSRHLESLLRAVSGRSPRARVTLPGGWWGVAGGGRLRFERPERPRGRPPRFPRRAGPPDARLSGRRVRDRSRPAAGPSRRAGTDGRHPTIGRR